MVVKFQRLPNGGYIWDSLIFHYGHFQYLEVLDNKIVLFIHKQVVLIKHFNNVGT